MASLSELLSGQGKERKAAVQQRYQVQYINYECLQASGFNFYPVEEIEELADAIELAGRVLQPLLVRRISPGRYEIIAGHRRWTAAKYLAEHGQQQYAMLPCHVQDGDDLMSRINLIVTNSQREKDAFTKMKEIQELETLLRQLAEGSEEERQQFYRISGLQEGEKVTARILRKIVARKSGLSETNVARLKHIDSSLGPELKEALESGIIGITAADELARLDQEGQKEAAEQLRMQDQSETDSEETGSGPERKAAGSVRKAAAERGRKQKQRLKEIAAMYMELYQRDPNLHSNEWPAMHEMLRTFFAEISVK